MPIFSHLHGRHNDSLVCSYFSL